APPTPRAPSGGRPDRASPGLLGGRARATMKRSGAIVHCHSWFSLLEGADAPEGLVRRAAEVGLDCLALTDRHSLAGAVPFLDARRELGVRPILGACLHHRGEHAVALIGEPEGYSSLCKVVSAVGRSAGDRLGGLLATYHDGLRVMADTPSMLQGLAPIFQ